MANKSSGLGKVTGVVAMVALVLMLMDAGLTYSVACRNERCSGEINEANPTLVWIFHNYGRSVGFLSLLIYTLGVLIFALILPRHIGIAIFGYLIFVHSGTVSGFFYETWWNTGEGVNLITIVALLVGVLIFIGLRKK